MSSEREIVLKDIEDIKSDLRVVKAEVEKTSDPVEKAELKRRTDRLEESIRTLEKRALAMIPYASW